MPSRKPADHAGLLQPGPVPQPPPATAGPPALPDELVLDIYRATMEPRAWVSILARLARLFGCQTAVCIRLDRVHPRESSMLCHNVPDEYLPELTRLDLAEDRIWRELLARPAGTVFRSTDAVPAEELVAHPLYQRIAVPVGMQYALLAVLENQPQAFADVGVTRADRDFDDAEIALMRELLPHLQTVLELERRIALGDAGRREALASFDRAGQPLVVLDRSGYALHCNALARNLLDRADGVELKFGRFVFDSIAVQAEFERVLRLALATPDGDIHLPAQEVRVPRRRSGAPFALSVISCANSTDRAVLPAGAGCMVLIHDADNPRHLPAERLAWLYRLTPAEVKVCEALYAAGSVDRAAADLGVTRHTVRSHLKSIYAKFGVATQGQLMLKLANSVWLTEGRGSAPGQATES